MIVLKFNIRPLRKPYSSHQKHAYTLWPPFTFLKLALSLLQSHKLDTCHH